MFRNTIRLSILVTLALGALAAPLAAQHHGGRGGPPHGGPPPEAIRACHGIEVGDACTVDTPRGDTIAGTCRATPHGTACVPAGMPGPDGTRDAP